MPETPWWMWVAFAVVVATALFLDLAVFGRRERKINVRAALWLTGGYITLGLAFAAAVGVALGSGPALAYLTGYLIEKSLSVDNILVFVVIFNHFDVPDRYQHRVLFWGVTGALVMRGLFIFAGAALLRQAEWIIYLFGLVAIIGGIRLLKVDKQGRDIEQNRMLRFLRAHLRITRSHKGSRFVVRQKGMLYVTPLFVVLLFIEFTDLVFALDSLPAIFGITRNEFLIYSSNAFAILGMRALYFAVTDMILRLAYLQYGLALLLMFIGGKMLAEAFIEIPVIVTLGITLAVLGGSILLSLWARNRRHGQGLAR